MRGIIDRENRRSPTWIALTAASVTVAMPWRPEWCHPQCPERDSNPHALSDNGF